MSKLVIRWLITAIAVAAAVIIIPGFHIGSDAAITVIAVAAILGLVNAFLRPILKMLSCGLIILTLGLFSLVINAATLLIASSIAQNLGVQFAVDGFWPAFWGALIISIVSGILSAFVTED